MLTDTERDAALKIVLSISDPNDYAATDDRLCAQYPAIETEDFVSLWQEASDRKKAEAEELRRFRQSPRFPAQRCGRRRPCRHRQAQ